MYFSISPHMVRAEFFKDYHGSMKWGYTEALDMSGVWDVTTAVHAVAVAWHLSDRLLVNYRIVVFDPYHRNGIPVMLDASGRVECIADVNRWNPQFIPNLVKSRSANA